MARPADLQSSVSFVSFSFPVTRFVFLSSENGSPEQNPKGFGSVRGLGALITRWRSILGSPVLELHDLVDPVSELGDARVDAGLVGLCAADAPRDDASQDPPLVVRPLDDHGPAAVALQGEPRK